MVFALVVAGVAVGTVVAAAERFYRFGNVPLFAAPLCWTTATAVQLGYIWFSRWMPHVGVRIAWTVVLAVATMLLWPITMLLVMFDDHGTIKTVAVSPDGRVELGTEEVNWSGDPAHSGCRVWLSERGGLFSRRALVWELDKGRCPTRVFFPNDTTLGLLEEGDTEPRTTTFDADRMQVTPIVPP